MMISFVTSILKHFKHSPLECILSHKILAKLPYRLLRLTFAVPTLLAE